MTIVISASKFDDIKQRDLLPSKNIRLFLLNDGLTANIDTEMDVKLAIDVTRLLQPYYAAFAQILTYTKGINSAAIVSQIQPIDIALVEFSMYSAIEVFHQRKIPVYAFCCCSGAFTASWMSIDPDTPISPDECYYTGGKEPSETFCLVDGTLGVFVKTKNTLYFAKEILINSSEALEPNVGTTFTELVAKSNIPVRFIGPLLPNATAKNSQENGAFISKVCQWIDGQEADGIVYFWVYRISFTRAANSNW